MALFTEFNLSSLDGTNGFKINGKAAEDNLGVSVSSAGDVNNDGFDDVIIGARPGELPRDDALPGTSYVVFGKESGFDANLDLSSLNGTNGFQMSASGHAVSSAGDVNDDGFGDLIIGAWSGNNFAGQSIVLFGKESSFDGNLDLSTLDGTNGFRINGETAFDRSGSFVSSAGDVNGDGFDDLIIGAPFADSFSGVCYVVFGNASGFAPDVALSSLDGTNGFQINSEDPGQNLGVVSSAGDVNGDGIDDLIIGAPRTGQNGVDSGASYVVFGKRSGFASELNLASLGGSNGFQINGEKTGDFAGFVSSAGDVDGDGFDDLIIGAQGADANGVNSGAIYVVFGRANGVAANLDLSTLDGTNGFKINGEAAGDYSGWSASSAGDVNGDGFDDLIIGARRSDPNGPDSGASYVVFGKASGFAAILDLSNLNGAEGFKINGEAEGDQSGWSVSAAGDVNGDGLDDLIIGAYYANSNGNTNSGASYVIFGSRDFGGPGVDLSSAKEIFEAKGKLPFLAALAQAAYHQAADEPGRIGTEAEGTRNLKKPGDLAVARAAHDQVLQFLDPLDTVDLPTLSPFSSLNGWSNGLRSEADAAGVYTNGNAGALLARSADALFVAFRGTNDALDGRFDHADWVARKQHFAKLTPLMEALTAYLAAGDTGITTIYLTGHSLGASMVQPAFEWLSSRLGTIKVEGVTFASPGYELDLTGLKDDPDRAITNFWNAADLINIAGAMSTIFGTEFTFNNVLSNVLDGAGPLDAHSMSLYRAMVEFLHAEGQDVGFDLDLSGLMTLSDAGLDRIAASIQVGEVGGALTFEIGARRDYVIAGLAEMALSAAGTLTEVLAAPSRTLSKLLTGFDAASDSLTALRAGRDVVDAETADDLRKLVSWENASALLGLASLLSPMATAAKAILDSGVEYFGEDLVVGGGAGDLLFGLGGADTLLGGDGADVLDGGLNADTLFGGMGADILQGGWGKDSLAGGLGNDYLEGNRGNDTLSGGANDDLLEGGEGIDLMEGGNGNDVYLLSDVGDIVVENPDAGIDLVVAPFSYILPAHVERLILDDRAFLKALFSNPSGTGNDLDNVITGNGEGNLLSGLNGSDVLSGGYGADELRGGDASDALFGDGGRDRLFGGQGQDTLTGGAARDELTGGVGADEFHFGRLADADGDWVMDFQQGIDVLVLSAIATEIGSALQFIGGARFSGAVGEVRFIQTSGLLTGDHTRVLIDATGDGKPDAAVSLAGFVALDGGSFEL